MPELPEVETVKRYLENQIVGQKILALSQRRDSLRLPLPAKLTEICHNARIVSIYRRAKYLIIELDNGYCLVLHLGMSGRFSLKPDNYQPLTHDHVIFLLENNQKLVFNDTRRFGMIYLCEKSKLNEQQYFANLGPEPLSAEFDANYLASKLYNKKAPIKTAIMDNHIVVGVGNIYASESLYLAGINPRKPAGVLNLTEITALTETIKEVLRRAIKAGGTTLRDFVGGNGEPGYFKQELNVYGKDGQGCKKCTAVIQKITQAGRSSYYCPECQK